MLSQHPLADEILYPRPGFDGKLTNQTCAIYAPDATCATWSIKEYALSDVGFQTEADRLHFTCRIAKDLYRICMGETDANGKMLVGFCRTNFTHSCGLFGCGPWKRHVDYFPITPYSAVLDSGVRCMNEEIYPQEGE